MRRVGTLPNPLTPPANRSESQVPWGSSARHGHCRQSLQTTPQISLGSSRVSWQKGIMSLSSSSFCQSLRNVQGFPKPALGWRTCWISLAQLSSGFLPTFSSFVKNPL